MPLTIHISAELLLVSVVQCVGVQKRFRRSSSTAVVISNHPLDVHHGDVKRNEIKLLAVGHEGKGSMVHDLHNSGKDEL